MTQITKNSNLKDAILEALFLPAAIFANSDLEKVKKGLAPLRETQADNILELFKTALKQDDNLSKLASATSKNIEERIDDIFANFSFNEDTFIEPENTIKAKDEALPEQE